MWMLGCILYELCTLRRPFDGSSLNQVLHRITKESFRPLPDSVSPIFHHLVEVLLQKTAGLRASVFEILDIPEIKDHIKQMNKREKSNQGPYRRKLHDGGDEKNQ